MEKFILKSIKFPPTLWEVLEKEAKEKNISTSAYIRLILSERNK